MQTLFICVCLHILLTSLWCLTGHFVGESSSVCWDHAVQYTMRSKFDICSWKGSWCSPWFLVLWILLSTLLLVRISCWLQFHDHRAFLEGLGEVGESTNFICSNCYGKSRLPGPLLTRISQKMPTLSARCTLPFELMKCTMDTGTIASCSVQHCGKHHVDKW